MRYHQVIVLHAIVLICKAFCGNAFLDQLMKQVQKKWMTSWQQMRDQQIRPRMFAQMHLRGSPTFVQSIEGNRGEVDLAISLHNSSTREISLIRIENIAHWLENRAPVVMDTVGENMGWPNAVGRVDNDVIPDSENTYWWMTSTYYPPQGSEGQIVLLPVATSNASVGMSPTVIASVGEGSDWYYSMIDWIDMNQDGWPDVVTSRSRGRPGAIQFSELIWLENPGYRTLWSGRTSWRQHPITHGPDVSIKVLRIPLPSGESRIVIIGAGYWDNKLYAVWTDDPEENWSNVDAINERVIDNHGWFFDLQLADVNADGRDDLIVSTWTYGVRRGSVIVYEIPCDFIRGKWRRHTLIDGAIDMSVPDLGSGGKINVFHPVSRYNQISQKKKPFIIVSGDDDGKVYVLIPNSRQTNNWEYTSHTIFQTRGPVGQIAIDDLNNDGFMEIVIPVLDAEKLVFFTYEPNLIGPRYFVDETRPGSDDVTELND